MSVPCPHCARPVSVMGRICGNCGAEIDRVPEAWNTTVVEDLRWLATDAPMCRVEL